MSYTVIKRVHACDKPDPHVEKLAAGTVICCDECQTEWVLTWFGWTKVRKEQP